MNNPELDDKIEKDTKLKDFVVDYTGDSLGLDPDRDSITLKDIVEVFSKDFPEFTLALAEENWILGYHQALTDIETGEAEYKRMLEENEETRGVH